MFLEGNGTSGGRAWWEADKVSVREYRIPRDNLKNDPNFRVKI